MPTARFVHVMHNHGRRSGEYYKGSIQWIWLFVSLLVRV
jgi:hypothetical protein